MVGEERFEYVALSYVWGMNQSYVTTMETIKEKTSILDNASPRLSIPLGGFAMHYSRLQRG
jgi:hypothetical protein